MSDGTYSLSDIANCLTASSSHTNSNNTFYVEIPYGLCLFVTFHGSTDGHSGAYLVRRTSSSSYSRVITLEKATSLTVEAITSGSYNGYVKVSGSSVTTLTYWMIRLGK